MPASNGAVEIPWATGRLVYAPVVCLVMGVLSAALALISDPVRAPYLVTGGGWLVLGLVSLRRGLRLRHQVALRIGPDGISTGAGFHQDWEGIAMIWVGSTPWRLPLRALWSPRIWVYTRSGVETARRTDSDLRPSATFAVPAPCSVTELSEVVRAFAPAPVVDGGTVSRWKAERGLEAGH